MTYSSAIFDHQNTNLSDAQLNKYKIIADSYHSMKIQKH